MCLPIKNDQSACCNGPAADGDDARARRSNVGNTTLLSAAGLGAVMLIACIAGPALIAVAGGALAIGTLGLAGGALAIALCVAAPLAMRAWQSNRSQAGDGPPAA